MRILKRIVRWFRPKKKAVRPGTRACMKCGEEVNAWRTHVGGEVLCVPCATRKR